MLLVASLVFGLAGTAQEVSDNGYTLIINGYDWGPAANKVVLPFQQNDKDVSVLNFTVSVQRSAQGVAMGANEASGDRKVVHSYISDKQGKVNAKGNHLTLVLDVSPNDPLSSPIKYISQNGRGSNAWISYDLTIKHTPSNSIWDRETSRSIPPLDGFDTTGTHRHNTTVLTYASFTPAASQAKSPLLIWLHGGGEGGTDPSIALMANKAWNYASNEIQTIFNGAYVLVPQAPTFWMQAKDGGYTRGDKNDIYNEALMSLIKKYVTDNPAIDTNRIYVGGCSNGGYMSLKLLINHPDYFAAGYISALAYQDKYVTDKQINALRETPIWFIHSKDDPVTVPEETVVPLYKRIVAAGGENVHFSYYDHVVDLSGFFGGEDYHYSGHWSWIYSHTNHADFDFSGNAVMVQGQPISLMQWLAKQQKK